MKNTIITITDIKHTNINQPIIANKAIQAETKPALDKLEAKHIL